MSDTVRRIRRGVFLLAGALLAGLAALRLGDVDRRVLAILAVAAGLLVALLLITYRAFAGVAEAARNAPQPSRIDRNEDEDER